MKYENFEQFKLHTKDIHKALVARLKDSAPKLSDIREAVAQSLKYENLATYKALIDAKTSQLVRPDEMPDNLGRLVICVEGLHYDENDEPVTVALSPDVAFSDLCRGDFKYQREIRSDQYPLDQLGQEMLSKAIVTDVWVECPTLSRYGIPDVANYATCVKAISEQFNFKVLTSIFPSILDRGDDGGVTIFFELAVDQAFFNALGDLELIESD